MAKKEKNLVKSLILIVLGVVSILAFFVNPFLKLTAKSGSSSKSTNSTLFGKYKEGSNTMEMEDWLKLLGKDNALTAFNLLKIFAIIAIVLLIAIAVFEILKFANINLGKIEKLIGLILVLVTVLAIVFAIAFFCGSTTEQTSTKIFFSTGISFYFVIVPGLICGAVAGLDK